MNKNQKIGVYYFKIREQHRNYLDNFLEILPLFLKRRILRFYFLDDQMRSVVGKLILRKMMITNGYQTDILNEYKLDKFNRPYFDNNVDFNITHSGDYVICAISNDSKIGVDIEKIYPSINVDDYEFLFHDNEKHIIKDQTIKNIFFSYWTKKEAVSKAIGKGLGVPFCDIQICDDVAIFKEKHWNLMSVISNKKYCSCIAYMGEKNIEIRELFISDLI